jgi:hypothetical protein
MVQPGTQHGQAFGDAHAPLIEGQGSGLFSSSPFQMILVVMRAPQDSEVRHAELGNMSALATQRVQAVDRGHS